MCLLLLFFLDLLPTLHSNIRYDYSFWHALDYTRAERGRQVLSSLGGHLFLIDPGVLRLLVGDEVLLGEPESNLLLGVLNRVRTMADVAADILNLS